jgi:imidazolonepropionase-like amidohydrolase
MAILRGGLRILVAAALAGCVLAPLASAQGTDHTPRVHALVGARIWQGPGRVIEHGTVVIRDGVIEAVGASVVPPVDARIWTMDSLTVYPGLIDAAMVIKEAPSSPGDQPGPGRRGEEKKPVEGTPHELSVVTPEMILADHLALKDGDLKVRRGQGFTAARVLPASGVFRGQAAVVNLGDGDLSGNLLLRATDQVLSFATARGDQYPTSVMGVVAVLRQTFYDARWYEDTQAAYAAHPRGVERPEANAALAALVPAARGKFPLLMITDDVLDVLRADGIAKEFGLRFAYVGSGEEYKRLDDVTSITRSLVVPVNFPEAPDVSTPEKALGVTLETLRAWDMAPANPAKLHAAGVEIALSATGLKDAGSFRKNVRRAIEAGLPAETAIVACTDVPARMLGLGDRLGTVDVGKIADLTVTDGDLFAEKTKVRAVWVDGDRYETEEVKPPEGDPRGTWDLTATTEEGESISFQLVVSGEKDAPVAKILIMGQEISARVSQSGRVLVLAYPTDALGAPGEGRMSFEFSGDGGSGSGEAVGSRFTVSGTRSAKPPSAVPQLEGGTLR